VHYEAGWRISNGGSNWIEIQPWGEEPRTFYAGAFGEPVLDQRMTVWLPNGRRFQRVMLHLPQAPRPVDPGATPVLTSLRLHTRQQIAIVAQFGAFLAWPAVRQPRILGRELVKLVGDKDPGMWQRVKRAMAALIDDMARAGALDHLPQPIRIIGADSGTYAAKVILRYLIATRSFGFDDAFTIAKDHDWRWLRPDTGDGFTGREGADRLIRFDLPPHEPEGSPA
jgi:hypothetical protein